MKIRVFTLSKTGEGKFKVRFLGSRLNKPVTLITTAKLQKWSTAEVTLPDEYRESIEAGVPLRFYFTAEVWKNQ